MFGVPSFILHLRSRLAIYLKSVNVYVSREELGAGISNDEIHKVRCFFLRCSLSPDVYQIDLAGHTHTLVAVVPASQSSESYLVTPEELWTSALGVSQ